ncbi:hypothetical protein CURTO8I2_140025 [Curtobacterium sp. 8I-2]|nr:hypothetical protein CURTO8I2_140025 [Curtobacterium sp. 8I-2]
MRKHGGGRLVSQTVLDSSHA